jgi:hypothetical protein
MPPKREIMTDVVFDAPKAACPRCKRSCKRHTRRCSVRMGFKGEKWRVLSSTHWCKECGKFFTNLPAEWRRYHYAPEVRKFVAERYNNGDITLAKLAKFLWVEHGIKVPETTIHEWVNASV